jgi:hypothetical protein
MIPPGQPILVGHHSEKGHRAHLNRIDRHFAKAKEHHDKADYFRRRAAAVDSNRAIFSDDPDASEKLIDKLERLKKRQGLMKRANQLIRKADREGLAELGFADAWPNKRRFPRRSPFRVTSLTQPPLLKPVSPKISFEWLCIRLTNSSPSTIWWLSPD